MVMCDVCEKGVQKISFSRHKKGSSGAGGTWALRAPIHKRTQKPNLHNFKSMKLCTKCLRMVKSAISTVQSTPSAS
jgi:hypothetical protein